MVLGYNETTQVVFVRGRKQVSFLVTQDVSSAVADTAQPLKGLLINICLAYCNLSIGEKKYPFILAHYRQPL